MVASHEYSESATDPALDTWFTEAGYEISDMCATHDSEVEGSWVQPEWDDHENTCLLADIEPPHVLAVTEAGLSLGPHEVELAGVVNPEGSETHYHFEYGATASYGTSVPVPDANAGSTSSNVSVSQTVKALAEDVYHYRLVATNRSGTTYGEDRLAVSPGFSTQTLPMPSDEASEEHGANGISCVPPQTCVAVGAYPSSTAHTLVTLAEVWNGQAWSVMATPNPPGAAESLLRRVSCVSSTDCMAVGYYKNSSGTELTLAEGFNGVEWSIQSTPNPFRATESDLRAVSCVSSTECTAVGYYRNSSGTELTLAERFNGVEWSVQSTPNPSGATESQLRGVSCSSSNECTAVGYYRNSSGIELTLAERWNGTVWSVQPTANLTYGGYLSDVSCTSSRACTAVGDQEQLVHGSFTVTTLAERWNGTEWSVQSTYPSDETGSLNGVSCTSATVCTAVGGYFNNVASYPFAEVLGERWNGTTWKVVAMSGLPRSSGMWRENGLNAVSCAEATACIAVGETITAPWGGLGSEVGFAEREFAAPIVTTEAASGVTSSEAVLSGTVNPQALETHYHFEYGTTTSYGESAPAPDGSAGSAVGYTKASQLITGLQWEVTYHYRLVASNAAETTYGEDDTFTTAAPPPPSSIVPPTISGSAVEGRTLTEAHGLWMNDPTSYAYQWEDCDSAGNNCSNIAGATGQTYTLTATDVGHTTRVQETATNAGGTGGAASAIATAVVQGAGSGGSEGSSGFGGQRGGNTAHVTSVSAASVHGDIVLVPLSCHGSAGSSCMVTLTLTVLEELRRGRLVAVSAATGKRRRVVIVGRTTITLSGGESELERAALNATGRRLLMARHVLAVKLTVSESGVRLLSQIVRFKAPARGTRRRR